MKAEFSDNGALVIVAENGTEKYALEAWFAAFDARTAILGIDTKTGVQASPDRLARPLMNHGEPT